MNVLRVKPGVKFDPIGPAGFRILGALEQTARRLQLDLVITGGSEAHPADDPHSKGEAYDVRTHDFTNDQKLMLLRQVMLDLADDPAGLDAPMAINGGLATLRFFGWIEHPGEATEHLHIQRRRGTVYV